MSGKAKRFFIPTLVFLFLFLLVGCSRAQSAPDFQKLANNSDRFVVSLRQGMELEYREFDCETEKPEIAALLTKLQTALSVCESDENYRPAEGGWDWGIACYRNDTVLFSVQVFPQTSGWHIQYRLDTQNYFYFYFPCSDAYPNYCTVPQEIEELLQELYRLAPGTLADSGINEELLSLLESG